MVLFLDVNTVSFFLKIASFDIIIWILFYFSITNINLLKKIIGDNVHLPVVVGEIVIVDAKKSIKQK